MYVVLMVCERVKGLHVVLTPSSFTHTHTHTHFYTVVDHSNSMVGSYGPKTEIQSFMTQPEDAPSGMLARGLYKIKSKFTDDDKNIYLEWEWALKICK